MQVFKNKTKKTEKKKTKVLKFLVLFALALREPGPRVAENRNIDPRGSEGKREQVQLRGAALASSSAVLPPPA